MPKKKNGGSTKKKTTKKTKKDSDEKVDPSDPPVKRVKFDSRADTYEHILKVQGFLFKIVAALIKRAHAHDQSKLEEPEKEFWDKYTPFIGDTNYTSDEYRERLESGLKVALDHHYAKNDHHPQHFPNGLSDMNIVQVVEMLCDWKASSERQHDGNIRQSLEHNKERFKISAQLYKIFENTVKELGW